MFYCLLCYQDENKYNGYMILTVKAQPETRPFLY